MKNKELEKLLEQLRSEMESTDQMDQESRSLLQQVDADIHSLLNQTDKFKPEPSVTERMQKAVEHFEATHPTLTSMLSEISTILSNAGI